MIVPIFCERNSSIIMTLLKFILLSVLLLYSYSFCKLAALLVRLSEHIYCKAEDNNGNDEAYNTENAVNSSCEEVAEAVYNKCSSVSKSALIADRDPEPLGVVHLTLDSAHCCEAGCAEEVEDKEGHTAYGSECCTHCGIYGLVSAAVENAEGTNDVFLCNKTCDSCNGCLPVAQPRGANIQQIALPTAARMLYSI